MPVINLFSVNSEFQNPKLVANSNPDDPNFGKIVSEYPHTTTDREGNQIEVMHRVVRLEASGDQKVGNLITHATRTAFSRDIPKIAADGSFQYSIPAEIPEGSTVAGRLQLTEQFELPHRKATPVQVPGKGYVLVDGKPYYRVITWLKPTENQPDVLLSGVRSFSSELPEGFELEDAPDEPGSVNKAAEDQVAEPKAEPKPKADA